MPKNVCLECGLASPEGFPAGMCPNCLLKLGVQSTPSPADMSAVDSDTTLVAPSMPEATSPGAGEPSKDRIPRYKLFEPIGEGGFGEVWMAEQQEPVRRLVALKIIKLGMDTKEVVARFEAERQALAMMDHPNIAKVFDGGATESGRPYFAMELVRGLRITQYCDTKKLNTEERIRLFIQVCQAVQHAHQKGVIHRDLKPSNVLVTELDDRSVPKVIDFGIAKATEQKLTSKTLFTRFNQIIGTPVYMSPEQAGLGGLDIDTRSDIYSLGVLLYELLTGRTPFSREELFKAGMDGMLRAIRDREPPKPSTRLSTLAEDELLTIAAQRRLEPEKLNRLVRGELDWIVMKALEKDRARRYESASGLARDLDRYLNSEPVSAAAPGFGYQLAKFAKRNRIALATGSAFLLVLLIGSVVSVWQAIRATRHADGEARERQAAVIAQGEAERQQRIAETNLMSARRNLYFADMSVAGQAIRLSNLGRGRGILDKYSARPGEEDLRGWEWSYLQNVSRDRTDFELPYPRGAVGRICFLPDGRHVAVASGDHVILWNWPERTIARRFGQPAGNAMDISRDGTFCVVGEPEAIAIYRLPEGVLQTRLPLPRRRGSAPTGPQVVDLAISPDGDSICASLSHGSARIDFVLLRLRGPGRGDVKMWNLTDVAAAHGSRIAFSPDGNRLAFGASAGTIQIVRLGDGEVEKTIYAHEDNITALSFSPDSRTLAVGSGYADSLVRLYAITNDWRPTILRGHLGWVKGLAFTRDGKRLISGSADQTVRIWDVESGIALRTLYGPSDEIYHIGLSPDGRHLLAGSKSGELKGWDLERLLASPESGVTLPYGAVRMDRDLKRFAGFVSVQSGSIVHGEVGDASPRVIEALGTNNIWLALSPEGDRIAAMGGDRVLRLWRAGDGRLMEQRWLSPTNGLHHLEFLPGRGELVTVDVTREVRRWTRDLQPAGGFTLPPGAVLNLSERGSFVRGSNLMLARQPAVGALLVVDLVEEKVVGQISRGGVLSDAVLSPDGQTLLVGDEGGGLWLWDTKTWDLKGPPLRGHLLAVNAAAFSPDGRRIVSGGSSNDIRVWDVDSNQEICALPADTRRCWLLRFSMDGKRFAYGLNGEEGVRVLSMPAEAPPNLVKRVPQGFRVGDRMMGDEFDGGPELPWSIRHEDTNHYSYQAKAGHLTIHTQAGGFYGNSTNYQNLFLVPVSSLMLTNLAVVTKIDDFAPAKPFQQAGVILFIDEDNSLKLTVEPPVAAGPGIERKPDEMRNLSMVLETRGMPAFGRAPLGGGSGPVWLRIMRMGSLYQCQFSFDGKEWTVAYEVPWDFYGPDYAGLVAKNGAGGTTEPMPAHFDFFEIRNVETLWEPAKP